MDDTDRPDIPEELRGYGNFARYLFNAHAGYITGVSPNTIDKKYKETRLHLSWYVLAQEVAKAVAGQTTVFKMPELPTVQ